MAMIASDIFTRYFRLYRSAHTPANGEINTMGSMEAQEKSAIKPPDFIVSVTCQVIA
jgi:hypothetical protein